MRNNILAGMTEGLVRAHAVASSLFRKVIEDALGNITVFLPLIIMTVLRPYIFSAVGRMERQLKKGPLKRSSSSYLLSVSQSSSSNFPSYKVKWRGKKTKEGPSQLLTIIIIIVVTNVLHDCHHKHHQNY